MPFLPTHTLANCLQGMATSECDSSVREHFHELLQFVSRYRWVYDVQMTRFVELKWWERIPAEVGLVIVTLILSHSGSQACGDQ